ncbi:A/G-specific adenine glycosylase [Conchiformibius kuhniae]|uniref:Adenine DNA glycosylase n=1 Tax=Conchiformibius kuhniae TaxID=211502 RepID=A0ABD8B7T2_9NEIS|nr:A/G-specific adenine glycosylase [Conchiformibius kuhniae]
MPHSPSFACRLIAWQKTSGRHGLAWQVSDPYCVWLSEIMLQQTQVATVSAYYPRFLAAFPNVHALAAAAQDEVLALWAGLGYYSRARNLHKAAQQIVSDFGGTFPAERRELETLCGVGRSTAAAIAAFAFKQRETILDGNVKRVLCRVFALDGNPADKAFEQQLWTVAESLLPECADDMPAYTQGLMDLGATVCKRSKPDCPACPMTDICQAKAQNRTAELPRRKVSAAVPEVPLFWLKLTNGKGEILLVKRPQQGIWAGLYCLPCFDDETALHRFAAAWGIAPVHLRADTPVKHRLTHRLLRIAPFAATLPDPHPTPECNGTWVSANALANHGLPKPLARYLAPSNL